MQAGRPGGLHCGPRSTTSRPWCGPASQSWAYYKASRWPASFFRKNETLVEFKRIQAMADAIPLVVPADTPAYAKGGSISWDGFDCLAVAGQMIVGATPVTFSLTLNWTDGDGSEAKVSRPTSRPPPTFWATCSARF